MECGWLDGGCVVGGDFCGLQLAGCLWGGCLGGLGSVGLVLYFLTVPFGVLLFSVIGPSWFLTGESCSLDCCWYVGFFNVRICRFLSTKGLDNYARWPCVSA